MRWEWFGLRLVHFWTPIIDPDEEWWRDLHVRAHMLGGVVWSIVFHFLILATPHGGHTLDFRHSVWLRLLGVAVVQATLWEMVQKENWRPELIPGTPRNAGYPWLSAIWDVLFTVLGAALFEVAVWLLTVVT